MDPWVLWVIAGVVLAVGEMLSLGFFLAPFAAGAFGGAVVGIAGGGVVASWVVFVLLSALLLTVVRPIARAHLKTPASLRTGTAALVGREGLVVAAIEGPENTGRVKIDGEVWTARGYEGEPIAEGTKVQVVEIRGATALVTA